MRSDLPLVKDVVLIGGGHTHAFVLRRFGMKPIPGARLTLINPEPTAPYSGMLPGHIAGHYARDELDIDLVRLARFSGARLILGTAEGIDRQAGTIHVAGHPAVRYDIASIDIGITSDMPALPGFAEHAVPAKPLGQFAARWRAFLDAPGPVALIGGGLAGVEVALAMRHRLDVGGVHPPVTILERDTILSGMGERARHRLRAALSEADISVRENSEIVSVGPGFVSLPDGSEVPAALTVGTGGSKPYSWLAGTGLDLTDGFVTVGPDLRSVSDPAIYAAGDTAHLSHAPRPKAGVYAVRAAPILAANIRADLTGGARRPYRPQGDYLKLVSLGRKSALAHKWGLAPVGDWIWAWKNRIDRRFMQKFNDLPKMTTRPLPRGAVKGVAEALGSKPLCGACGAKVGAGTLDAAIARLPAMPREDVEVAAGDDAAVLRVGDTRQVITTDHLRAFWPDPYLAARITLCHALGDVWAMGAAPQAILAQITLPRLAPALEADFLAEILAGAGEVAQAAGAAIVGGHTSVGAELTLGFSVTGLLDGPPRTIAGARPGDALILTRPIGTGVILAGEMSLDAKGADVARCLRLMSEPSGDVAQRLSAATAMTDVTGFGLAGHVGRMARASGAGAVIDIDAVPVHSGALELAEAGVRSTLYPANRAAVPELAGESGARVDLLFDPQTAGGFLAAHPAGTAQEIVQGLRDEGHHAAVIGEITDGYGVSLA